MSIAQSLSDDDFNNLDEAGGWLVLWDSAGSVAFVSPEDPSTIVHRTDLQDAFDDYIDALVYNSSAQKTFAVDADQSSLVVVDHTGGEDAVETVDLSEYDEDGNPNASALWSDEGFVLIGLSRSDEEDSNDAGHPAKVLVMDAASLIAVTAPIPGTLRNNSASSAHF